MDDIVLEQLNQAINLILNPSSSTQQRTEAHSVCEACKQHEQSHLIGFSLASNLNYEPHVKHFGLQLMHNFVQGRWNKVSQEIQIQIKNNAMSLLQHCQLTEASYVKDGIAHVVVEIAKQVWPQNWPTMIGDLMSYSTKGIIQTELVELILLRLAEDVAVLQNISVAHRSKDIRQGLSLSMKEIIEFLLKTLQTNYAKYSSLHGSVNPEDQMNFQAHFHITQSTLYCLQGFLEWANIDHIFMNEGILLQLLCQMLNSGDLQLNAADCLRLIIARKGKIEERKLILNLTNTDYVNIMVNSIKPIHDGSSTCEKHYKFQKILGQIFGGLASQIVSHWLEKEGMSKEKDCITSLDDKTTFLDVLLAFLGHDSRVISNTVAISWVQMIRHKLMLKDPILQSYVTKVLPIIQVQIKKHQKSAPHLLAIEEKDFNDHEKLELFYKSSRMVMIELLRFCTKCLPLGTLNFTLKWLQNILQTPIDNGTDPETGIKRETPTVKSPVYVEWEAMYVGLDMVFGVLLLSLEEKKQSDQLPLELMEDLCVQILKFPTTDPLVWITLIHTAASFFHVFTALPHKMAITVQFLNVIMDIMRKTAVSDKTTAITSLRRQTSAILIRLCKVHPAIVNATPEFKPLMLNIVNDENVLSPHEKISMFECLVLVSGEWKNFQQQSQLIAEIMGLEQNMWKPLNSEVLQDSTKFAKAIGLCDSGEPSPEKDTCDDFRRSVSYCIVLIAGMISRSQVPESMDECKLGGFIDQNGKIVNPCAPHIAPVLDYIVSFMDMMHSVWTSSVLRFVHKNMLPALAMKESERQGLLISGPEQYLLPPPSDDITPTPKEPWEHLQTFLAVNLEQIYQILGRAGGCLGAQFYSNPNLVPLVLSKMFKNLQTLPELRLKCFIRQFLYYFFKQCPDELHKTVTCPLLHQYCLFMNHRLKANWTEYAAKEKVRLKVFNQDDRPNEDNEEKEEDEIVKEQVLRLVSREHLEMIVNLCVQKKPSMAKRKLDRAAALEHQNGNGTNSNGSSPTNTPGDIVMSSGSTDTALLTRLALSVMESEGAETLLSTGLLGLSWYDTITVNKAIQILWPVLKHTFEAMPFLSEEAAKFIFESILIGLQRHGQHEGCQAQLLALGLLVWMKLRPNHNSLKHTLQQIPHVDKNLLEEFDTKYLKFNEKRKKMCFKKLTSGIIEHHVGQRFKSEQNMSLLPRIFNQRTKSKPLSELEPQSLGLQYFFQPENL